jgi:Sulfotransferase domain
MPTIAGRRLPDFIGVGPPRTATTWLHEVLTGYVGLPLNRKETDFFSRRYEMGLDWYLDYFRRCDPNLPMGEFSPMYFMSDDARERIARDIPGCRIICSFRDPVARVHSQWRLMVRNAWTKVELAEAVEKHRELRESSRYGHYLGEWIRTFGADNVLVLFHEDLDRDAQAFVDSVCRFIGIQSVRVEDSPVAQTRVHPVDVRPKNRRLARQARNLMAFLNDRRYHRLATRFRQSALWHLAAERGAPFGSVDDTTEAALRERFRPEVEELERLTGRDLSNWKIPRARRLGASSRSAVA